MRKSYLLYLALEGKRRRISSQKIDTILSDNIFEILEYTHLHIKVGEDIFLHNFPIFERIRYKNYSNILDDFLFSKKGNKSFTFILQKQSFILKKLLELPKTKSHIWLHNSTKDEIFLLKKLYPSHNFHNKLFLEQRFNEKFDKVILEFPYNIENIMRYFSKIKKIIKDRGKILIFTRRDFFLLDKFKEERNYILKNFSVEYLYFSTRTSMSLMNQNIIILKGKYPNEKTSFEFFEMDKGANFIKDIKQNSFVDKFWYPDIIGKKNALGDFAKILSPHSFKDAQIKNSNLSSQHLKVEKIMKKDSEDIPKANMVRGNDIIISSFFRGGNIGLALKEDRKLIVDRGLFIIRAGNIHPGYLFYYLKSERFLKEFKKRAVGVMRRISVKLLYSIPIERLSGNKEKELGEKEIKDEYLYRKKLKKFSKMRKNLSEKEFFIKKKNLTLGKIVEFIPIEKRPDEFFFASFDDFDFHCLEIKNIHSSNKEHISLRLNQPLLKNCIALKIEGGLTLPQFIIYKQDKKIFIPNTFVVMKPKNISIDKLTGYFFSKTFSGQLKKIVQLHSRRDHFIFRLKKEELSNFRL